MTEMHDTGLVKTRSTPCYLKNSAEIGKPEYSSKIWVYLLGYVPNMGAILNVSQFFRWKGGRVIYQITSAFSAKFISVNRFEVGVTFRKLQHILLQVTEELGNMNEKILLLK